MTREILQISAELQKEGFTKGAGRLAALAKKLTKEGLIPPELIQAEKSADYSFARPFFVEEIQRRVVDGEITHKNKGILFRLSKNIGIEPDSIVFLCLKSSAINPLRKSNQIRTISDLRNSIDNKMLRHIDNIGPQMIKEIKNQLARFDTFVVSQNKAS